MFCLLFEKDPRSIRWPDLVIRWCLQIAFCAKTRGYNAIRGEGYRKSPDDKQWEWAGYLILPSLRTLFDYSHFDHVKPGWKQSSFVKLFELCKQRGLSGHGRWKQY